MLSLKKINDGGVFGIYALGSKDTYLLLFHFKSIQFWSVKEGSTIFIDPAFDSNKLDIIEMSEHVLAEHRLGKAPLPDLRDYRKIPGKSLTVMVSAPTPKSFIPLSTPRAVAYMTKLGFDVVGLSKTLESTMTVRDYSALMKKPEAAEQFELIKRAVNGKEMPKEYQMLAKSIRNGLFNCVFLVGPAATGKTFLTYFISQFCNAPLLTMQGSEGVEKDEIIGSSDVNTDPGAVSQFKVIIGLLLKAYIEGYQITIDEANYVLPGIMAVINSMVDDTPTYTFKGVTYKRHPNFVLYLTSNPDYEGTYLYNPATKTRGITVAVDRLTEAEFVKRMLVKSNKKLSAEFFKELFSFGALIQEYANKWQESAAVGLRHADHFAQLILMDSVDLPGFVQALRLSYLNNMLTMDHDNTVKLNSLIVDTEFKRRVEQLYSFYDYRVSPDVEPKYEFSDFVSTAIVDDDAPSVKTAPGRLDDDDFEAEFEKVFSKEDFSDEKVEEKKE